jgi:hypothetical protein
MKKSIVFLLAICLISEFPSNAQGGILKKVTNSMVNELLGTQEKTKPKEEPEPSCSCNQAEVILDLGGKFSIDYKELNISVKDDGRILLHDRLTNKYYIVQGSVTQGPFESNDPKVAEFESVDEDDKSIDRFILRNKPYLAKSGDKLVINFDGKSYGPYAQITNFTVSKTKEKFAAVVIENMVTTEDQGKKMEAAMKNAKSDQERMDLAMQYGQQMQQKMMQGGGPTSMLPKLVTNIPNSTYDPSQSIGGTLNGNIKYDDILFVAYDKLMDLQGKTLLTVKPEVIAGGQLFVNQANNKYAVYNFGKLAFSDNTSLSDLFNPYLVKTDGKIYLAYMYYSPKKNSIMQCKVQF